MNPHKAGISKKATQRRINPHLMEIEPRFITPGLFSNPLINRPDMVYRCCFSCLNVNMLSHNCLHLNIKLKAILRTMPPNALKNQRNRSSRQSRQSETDLGGQLTPPWIGDRAIQVEMKSSRPVRKVSATYETIIHYNIININIYINNI